MKKGGIIAGMAAGAMAVAALVSGKGPAPVDTDASAPRLEETDKAGPHHGAAPEAVAPEELDSGLGGDRHRGCSAKSQSKPMC